MLYYTRFSRCFFVVVEAFSFVCTRLLFILCFAEYSGKCRVCCNGSIHSIIVSACTHYLFIIYTYIYIVYTYTDLCLYIRIYIFKIFMLFCFFCAFIVLSNWTFFINFYYNEKKMSVDNGIHFLSLVVSPRVFSLSFFSIFLSHETNTQEHGLRNTIFSSWITQRANKLHRIFSWSKNYKCKFHLSLSHFVDLDLALSFTHSFLAQQHLPNYRFGCFCSSRMTWLIFNCFLNCSWNVCMCPRVYSFRLCLLQVCMWVDTLWSFSPEWNCAACTE